MFRSTLIAFTAALVFASPAIAASSSQIHRDAADGSIDGSYTLAEMRAADRSVSAEQREYYGWEDVYAAWLRAQSNPDEVVAAVPVDTDRDGKIEPEERAAAEKKTRAKCTRATAAAKRSSVCRKVSEDQPEAVEPDEEIDEDDDRGAASSRDSEDDGGTSPLLWLIVGIPLVIVGLGAYRMRRNKPKGDPAP